MEDLYTETIKMFESNQKNYDIESYRDGFSMLEVGAMADREVELRNIAKEKLKLYHLKKRLQKNLDVA